MVDGHPGRLAAADEAAVLMGIELSKKGWLVALRSALMDKVSLHRLRAGDAPGLLALAEALD